ncbi:MAG: serine hydrolase domain-containing protein [Usitatibacter sp.]
MSTRWRMRAICCAGAITLAACAVNSVTTEAQSLQVLDRELAAIAGDPARELTSLSVIALRGGEVAYERHFGRRFIDLSGRGADKPADANTLYRIASISKLVTTLGVMRLVEQGKLSLDADISNYLGYPVRNPQFPGIAITLRMLLTHTSSMRDDAGYYQFDANVNLRDMLVPGGALHADGAMWSRDHAPGTFFSYANLPWGVVATVMEKVSGERFDVLMARLVIEPLGMQGGYNPAALSPARLANLATLYRRRPAGESNDWNPRGPWIPQVDDYSLTAPVARAGNAYVPGSNGTLFGPQGGLRASARDLSRVMRMLAGGGMLEGRRFLEPESVATMLAPQWRHEGGNGESQYGDHRARFNEWGLGNQHFLDVTGPDYGDRLVRGGGFTAVGHLGDAYGLMGTLAFDPRSGDGLVFLVGGTGFDPETDRGTYSAAAGFEERIASALYRRAVQGRAD